MNTPIEEIVERRAHELLQKAVAGESLDAKEFEALTRLAALAGLAANARSARRRTWPIAAATLVTLVLVSALLYARVSSTEIELDTALSEVSFTVTSRQALLGTQNFVSVGADALEHLTLPSTSAGAPTGLDSVSGEWCNAELAVPGDASQPGVVSLNGLAVPSGTRISITHQAVDRVALTLTPPASQFLEIEVSVKGRVRTVAHCPSNMVNREQDYTSPQLIQLVAAASTPMTIQFTLVHGRALAFASQISFSNISMLQVDELVERTGSLAREVSSIESGVLHLESLNGKQVPLRPHEELRFSSSGGAIRMLSLSSRAGSDERTLALEAQASVRGMTIGSGPNVRSLMPTYLEWLSARQGLALLWGSTLYVTGILTSMLRWLRISR